MEIRSLNTIHALTLTKENLAKTKPPERQEVEKAVANNKLAATYLDKTQKGEKEIKISNYESADSDVRDVERAAELAQKVSFNILNFEHTALAAQANQSKDKVQALLE